MKARGPLGNCTTLEYNSCRKYGIRVRRAQSYGHGIATGEKNRRGITGYITKVGSRVSRDV